VSSDPRDEAAGRGGGAEPGAAGEAARLMALRRYAVLDTPVDPEFEAFSALAAGICDAPIALISLVDEHRQWFLSERGLGERETSLEVSFCVHAIRGSELFVVPDASADPRFRDNPLVTGPQHLRFYAGAPLVTPEGHSIGTLCVLDREPRALSDLQSGALQTLAHHIVNALELRVAARRLADTVEHLSEVFVTLDHALVVQGANEAAALLLEVPREQLLGDATGERHPLQALVGQCRRALESGGVVEQLWHDPTTARWFDVRVHPSSHGLTLLAHDLTERLAQDARYQLLFDNNPHPMWVYDLDDLSFLAVNEATTRTYGYSREELLAMKLTDIRPEQDADALLAHVRRIGDGLDHPGIWRHRTKSGRIIMMEIAAHSLPFAGRRARLVLAHDVTERLLSERMLSVELGVLEAISADLPLLEVLHTVAHGVERLIDGVAVSIMLVDPSGSCLRVGVAPSLPLAFTRAVEGTPVGVGFGSCGSATALREPVITEDIERATHWSERRELALAHGLRACWSLPISSATGQMIATLAVYARSTRLPQSSELSLLERMAHIVGIAVERDRAQAALRANEAQLRDTFAHAATGIATCALDGAMLDANQAYCDMLGYSLEELRKKSFLDLTHPDDRAMNAELVDALLSGERESLVFEKRYVHKSGRPVWTRLSTSVVRDADGRPVRIIGVAEDITEQKRAIQSSLESEERFRLLAKATNDAIYDWDLATDALWWNEGYQKLFGYRPEDIPPTIDSWSAHIHPEDRPRVIDEVTAAIDGTKTEWSGEYRFIRANGDVTWVLDRGHLIRDAGGTAVRMVGGMTDLTERRHAEERLREQATLLDRARDAIVVCDLEQRVEYWNESATRVYGWTAAEALGRSAAELLGRDAATFSAAIEATRAVGEWMGELEQATKTEEVILVESRWTLVRDEQDQPRALLLINTDVTERRKLEEQFLRAQRLESVGTLAGGIAHDLNNVLAPILMSIAMLREKEGDPSALADLRTIEACAQRGADMVRQLLSFARGVEGRRGSTDLRAIANEVMGIMRDSFPKSIKLELELAEELWPVHADPTQMHQLLTNLCVNARDAMPAGGRLTVGVERVVIDDVYAGQNIEAKPGPYVLIKVEDTGTGMPPEVLDRLFEPFFTTKEVGKGTGLGMPTAHSIVRNHGGFIRVFSEVGKGTRFEVYIPALLAPGAAEEVYLDKSAVPRGRGELVLVVDDEEGIRKVAKRTLERFGYRVLLAAHGAEAVSIYAQRGAEIAVVLTDMAMPVMDGPATIVALKTIHPAVRVIGSSGLGSDGNLARAANAGVSEFLAKPYSAETLLHTLRRVIDAPGA